jgi:hypothetical protein
MADGPTADELYAIRGELVKAINQEREDAGLPPLVIDSITSDAAELHCQEMVDNDYSSHWSLKGEKPYQRYFQAGCRDHVTEVFGGLDAPADTTFELTTDAIVRQLTDLHVKSAGEDSSAMDPLHTHIGIGFTVTETKIRMLEVYLDRYVRIDDDVATELNSTEVIVSGTMIEREGSWGPYACVVYYDEPLKELAPEEASSKDGYEDFSHHQVAVAWPWEMKFEANGKFSFPIRFDEIREGHYYVHLHVRDNSEGIPYDKIEEGLQVPGDGSVVSTGFIFHYIGQPLSAGQTRAGVSVDNSITDIRIVTSASSEGKDASDLDAYEKVVLGEHVEGASHGLSLYFRKGEVHQKPIVGMQFITGNDPDMPGPDGFEVLRVSLGTPTSNASNSGASRSSALQNLLEKSGGSEATNVTVAQVLWENDEVKAVLSEAGIDPVQVKEAVEKDADGTWTLSDYEDRFGDGVACGIYTYLCVARGDPTDAILDAALLFGENVDEVAAAAMGENPIIIKSPLPGVSVVYKTNQLQDNSAMEDLSLLTDGQGEDAFATTDEDTDAAYAQRAEEEAAQLMQRQEISREGQRAKLIQMLQEQEEENSQLQEANAELQKKLVIHMHGLASAKKATEDSAKDVAEQGKRKSEMELAKQYRESLQSVNDARDAVEREQAQYDEIALQLQDRLDEKEEKAENIRNSFATFKREIAIASENSRTGRPIPKKIIAKFEDTETEKDKDVSKVRLRNINLIMQLKKLEGKLREKEQLADGLHLIDFEQLKIENQTLNEKIEERNEDLHKLRKKTTTTVQVLTHIKEKLQFEQAQNELLKSELATLDGELTAERDQLAKAKREREKCRTENSKLQGEQGFVNNDMLVQDYERRKIVIKQMKQKCVELSAAYTNIQNMIKRATSS